MDDRPQEVSAKCERAIVAFSRPPIYLPASTALRLPFFFPFLPSLLHSKYPTFRFSHHLSFHSVLQGYPPWNAGYTFNRNRSRRVCLPGDSRETAVSWRKCRRKVDARPGHLGVASASTCVASGISSESPHVRRVIDRRNRSCTKVLSNIVCPG